MQNKKVSFPLLGNYHIPIKILFTKGLGVDYLTPPPITKRTLELGSRYSPDAVCAPFKYTLGNFIESLEKGANILVMVGGVCRLGYYGELDELILKDLGYDAKFVNFAGASFRKPQTFYDKFKEINPNLSLKKIAETLPLCLLMVEYIDELEDFIRKNIGFEVTKGDFEKAHKNFLKELEEVENKKELKHMYKRHKKIIKSIPVDIPKKPLKVGIVGEYYTIMEPHSNHFIEKNLAYKGIVVDRWMNLTNSIIHRPEKNTKERIKPYVKYDMGATSMYTIDRALNFAKEGYDGIIHIKSAGCTPEIDAMPVLQNISSDYKIPILYFSFDSQTSDTGVQTRLEAFHDMILMRKEKEDE